MGWLYKKLIANKKKWDDHGDRYRSLLQKAVTEEDDLSNEDVLELLVATRGTDIEDIQAVHEAVAARGKKGWLAEAGREAAESRKAKERCEAARWIQYGRKSRKVDADDLAAIHRLLVDKDDEVHGVACNSFEGMMADDPEGMTGPTLEWLGGLKAPERRTLSGRLAQSWASKRAGDVFALQAEALKRAPRERGQLIRDLEGSIRMRPISEVAAKRAWDDLLLPVMEHLIAEDWKQAPKGGDAALLYLMGTLLALRPKRPMIVRSENAIGRLIEARVERLPPTAIALGPWQWLGNDVKLIWPEYVSWWSSQLGQISRASDIWADDVQEDREALAQLETAPKPEPKDLDPGRAFRMSAYEFTRKR